MSDYANLFIATSTVGTNRALSGNCLSHRRQMAETCLDSHQIHSGRMQSHGSRVMSLQTPPPVFNTCLFIYLCLNIRRPSPIRLNDFVDGNNTVCRRDGSFVYPRYGVECLPGQPTAYETSAGVTDRWASQKQLVTTLRRL